MLKPSGWVLGCMTGYKSKRMGRGNDTQPEEFCGILA